MRLNEGKACQSSTAPPAGVKHWPLNKHGNSRLRKPAGADSRNRADFTSVMFHFDLSKYVEKLRNITEIIMFAALITDLTFND